MDCHIIYRAEGKVLKSEGANVAEGPGGPTPGLAGGSGGSPPRIFF